MPQRFLRPGITTSKRFNSLSFEAQSFYVRLLTLVDDFGRYDADPMLLRSHAFPFGSPEGKDISLKTIENICLQMSVNGIAIFYRDAEGKDYLQVTRWQERPRAAASRFPEFDNKCLQMFANDNKCSPPSPSPSPSPSPLSPRHSPIGLTSKPTAPTADELVAELQKDPTYEGINVRREYGKMLNWCKARKGIMPTRRRFINWLNKVERPIEAPKRNPTKLDLKWQDEQLRMEEQAKR